MYDGKSGGTHAWDGLKIWKARILNKGHLVNSRFSSLKFWFLKSEIREDLIAKCSLILHKSFQKFFEGTFDNVAHVIPNVRKIGSF